MKASYMQQAIDSGCNYNTNAVCLLLHVALALGVFLSMVMPDCAQQIA